MYYDRICRLVFKTLYILSPKHCPNIVTFLGNKIALPMPLDGSTNISGWFKRYTYYVQKKSINQSRKMSKFHPVGSLSKGSNSLFLVYCYLSKSVNQSVIFSVISVGRLNVNYIYSSISNIKLHQDLQCYTMFHLFHSFELEIYKKNPVNLDN